MPWLKSFIAGFLSTLVFHQGVMLLFHFAGLVPMPWNLSPVPPLGVPAVLSLAFWGGVWGLPVWWLIRRFSGATYYLWAIVAGAVGPTAVAMLVVFPLKDIPVSPDIVVGGLIVNGAWGLGVAVLMQLFGVRRLAAGA